MQQKLPQGVVIALIAIVVVGLGILGWKFLGNANGDSVKDRSEIATELKDASKKAGQDAIPDLPPDKDTISMGGGKK